MSQGPIGTLVNFLSSGKTATPALLDGGGNLPVTTGGVNSSLHMGAAAVIKPTPGRLACLIIMAPGSTGGAFTLNDCATTGAAAAGNQIFSLAYNSALNVVNAIFVFDWPCLVGLVLSAVPTGGTPLVNISWS